MTFDEQVKLMEQERTDMIILDGQATVATVALVARLKEEQRTVKRIHVGVWGTKTLRIEPLGEDIMILFSPYMADFIPVCRSLKSARWRGGVWEFDPNTEDILKIVRFGITNGLPTEFVYMDRCPIIATEATVEIAGVAEAVVAEAGAEKPNKIVRQLIRRGIEIVHQPDRLVPA